MPSSIIAFDIDRRRGKSAKPRITMAQPLARIATTQAQTQGKKRWNTRMRKRQADRGVERLAVGRSTMCAKNDARQPKMTPQVCATRTRPSLSAPQISGSHLNTRTAREV